MVLTSNESIIRLVFYTLMLNFFTQLPKNLSAQFDCPSRKVLDVNEKRLYWVSVVREANKVKEVLPYFQTLELRLFHMGTAR